MVNSNNTIIDHIWAWRADHGAGVGWTVNTADTGLIVNGDNVTAYGLFVEHYQKYEVVWNGNGGRTIFFQNEMPYDPPNQAAWMNGAHAGTPPTRSADAVTSHEGWGLGSYCYFNVDPAIARRPRVRGADKPGVKFHDLLTVSLGGTGTIDHVINTTGAAAQGTATVPVDRRQPSRGGATAGRGTLRRSAPQPGPARAGARRPPRCPGSGPRSSSASDTQPCQAISSACGCTGRRRSVDDVGTPPRSGRGVEADAARLGGAAPRASRSATGSVAAPSATASSPSWHSSMVVWPNGWRSACSAAAARICGSSRAPERQPGPAGRARSAPG